MLLLFLWFYIFFQRMSVCFLLVSIPCIYLFLGDIGRVQFVLRFLLQSNRNNELGVYSFLLHRSGKVFSDQAFQYRQVRLQKGLYEVLLPLCENGNCLVWGGVHHVKKEKKNRKIPALRVQPIEFS